MADDFGERTEPATPRRKQESRERGQVAKSQDLTAAVAMTAGMVALELTGRSLWGAMQSMMRAGLEGSPSVSEVGLGDFALLMLSTAGRTVIPFMIIILLAVLLALYMQVGWVFSWHPLTPSLNKISPLQGIKRIFSPRTAVSATVNIAKMILVAAVAYWTLVGGINRIVFSAQMDHVALYVMGAETLFRLGVRLSVVMLLLALIDFAYQRYRHEKDLRMSKEEIKEELKRMEGDPIMKRRRREVQMKLAMQRVQRDVPKADVVITNPTHLSIALRYDPASMNAPKVVAKGADWMAYRIRQIAAASGVPIVEKRELARLMYDAVQVGQEIPDRFYKAVAEVLAYVYELSGRKLGPSPVAVS